LSVVLSEAERLQFGEQAGRYDQEQKDLIEQKKAETSRLKGLVEQAGLKRQYLLGCLASGKETRDTETELIADFSSGVAVRYRKDTGEEIGRRPLTGREMQRRFDFEGVDPLENMVDRRWQGLGLDDATKTEPEQEGKDDAKEE
jgi:hypothetical protein